MMRKELGKIKSVLIGLGGYQDAMFGVTFELGGEGWGCGDFWGFWSPSVIKHDQYTKWTETDRISGIAEAMIRLDDIMKQAKVDDAMRLIGVPIEITFNGTTRESWRILTEVL